MSQTQPNTGPRRRRGPTQAQRRARNLAAFLGAIAILLGLLVALLPQTYRTSRDAGQTETGVPDSPAVVTQAPGDTAPRPDAPVPDVSNGAQTGDVSAPPSDEPQIGPVLAEPVFLSIVIDDVGYNLAELEPFLDLPGPITFAVLPGLPESREAAERIHRAGKPVIVHMPMEPIGRQDPGPGAILVAQDDEEILSRLDAGFETVPHAVGMNNHMGSRAVADPRVMNVVMSFLAERGLLFVDSRTSADSVAFRMADLYNVPFAERSVFLDNDVDDELVEAQLKEGLAVAAAQGQAVLIGHVQSPATVRVLARYLPHLEKKGFRLAPLATRVD